MHVYGKCLHAIDELFNAHSTVKLQMALGFWMKSIGLDILCCNSGYKLLSFNIWLPLVIIKVLTRA